MTTTHSSNATGRTGVRSLFSFKFASGLSIRSRISLGFGVVLILVAAVAGSAIYGAQKSIHSVNLFAENAGEAISSGELKQRFLSLQILVEQFASTGNQERSNEAAHAGGVLLKDLEGRLKADPDGPQAQTLKDLSGSLKEYLVGLVNVASLRRRLDSLVAHAVDPVGQSLTDNLTTLIAQAHQNGHIKIETFAQMVRDNAMKARLTAYMFLGRNDEALSAQVTKRIDEMTRLLGLIEKSLPEEHEGVQEQSDERVAFISAQRSLVGYGHAFESAATNMKTLREKIDGPMQEQATALTAGFDQLVSTAVNQEQQIHTSMTDRMAMTDRLILIVAAIALVVGSLLAFVLGGGLSRPIIAMTRAMGRLSEGDLTVQVPDLDRRDEVGQMAQALDIFKENMIQTKALEEEKAQNQALREQHQAELIGFIQSFEGTVLGVLDGLTHAEQMLRDTSRGVDQTASNVKDQAGRAGQSANEASENVQTVASTAEELTSSIQEISRQVSDASSVSQQAVQETDTAAHEIQALEQSVTKIGEIVDLINSIASQTNLLALNATIEAARAGDAGKGFAVVANEVKSLATQTAHATDEIASQIGQVQEVTGKAVSAVGRIGQVIHNINQISTGIASAVEEQSAATAEIARSADMAAQSTQSVATLMIDLNAAAEQSGVSAAEIASSSSELSKQSAVLKEEVRTFLNRVREGDDNPDEAELVSWEEEFGFDISSIDEDHRKLMELTNDLYREVKAGRKGAMMEDAFNKLRTYSTQHFSEEDEYMRHLGYPGTEDHVRHHDTFVSRLDALFARYQDGDPEAGMDMTALLGSWWRNHIVGDDSALATYVRDRKAEKAGKRENTRSLEIA